MLWPCVELLVVACAAADTWFVAGIYQSQLWIIVEAHSVSKWVSVYVYVYVCVFVSVFVRHTIKKDVEGSNKQVIRQIIGEAAKKDKSLQVETEQNAPGGNREKMLQVETECSSTAAALNCSQQRWILTVGRRVG